MAYGFEYRWAEEDEIVKSYLDEGMFFEAWIMIFRHWEGDWDELYFQWECEMNKKSTPLNEGELVSLDSEFFDCRKDAIGY